MRRDVFSKLSPEVQKFEQQKCEIDSLYFYNNYYKKKEDPELTNQSEVELICTAEEWFLRLAQRTSAQYGRPGNSYTEFPLSFSDAFMSSESVVSSSRVDDELHMIRFEDGTVIEMEDGVPVHQYTEHPTGTTTSPRYIAGIDPISNDGQPYIHRVTMRDEPERDNGTRTSRRGPSMRVTEHEEAGPFPTEALRQRRRELEEEEYAAMIRGRDRDFMFNRYNPETAMSEGIQRTPQPMIPWYEREASNNASLGPGIMEQIENAPVLRMPTNFDSAEFTRLWEAHQRTPSPIIFGTGGEEPATSEDYRNLWHQAGTGVHISDPPLEHNYADYHNRVRGRIENEIQEEIGRRSEQSDLPRETFADRLRPYQREYMDSMVRIQNNMEQHARQSVMIPPEYHHDAPDVPINNEQITETLAQMNASMIISSGRRTGSSWAARILNNFFNTNENG